MCELAWKREAVGVMRKWWVIATHTHQFAGARSVGHEELLLQRQRCGDNHACSHHMCARSKSHLRMPACRFVSQTVAHPAPASLTRSRKGSRQMRHITGDGPTPKGSHAQWGLSTPLRRVAGAPRPSMRLLVSLCQLPSSPPPSVPRSGRWAPAHKTGPYPCPLKHSLHLGATERAPGELARDVCFNVGGTSAGERRLRFAEYLIEAHALELDAHEWERRVPSR